MPPPRPGGKIGELGARQARSVDWGERPGRTVRRVHADAEAHAGYNGSAEYLRSVVRLFCGWAESPLWFTDGPVDLLEARLDPDLRFALKTWEADFEAALATTFRWPSPRVEAEHAARGRALADRLVEALGDAFEVQVDDPGGPGRLLIRGVGPGQAPESVAAFRRWAAESDLEGERFGILGPTGFRWDAGSPGERGTTPPRED